ncbi:SRPBCC family protein [Nocardia huaxiensis]|uniref:SRPBCC family protein n=1 Tax=Nocardia huaxiensis TaxID=2755382 RepID=A0A7D6ZDT5_9NOCA|nr:SRPBCC family protein [Nocardia huaxiensis]QLY31298.1 SRPBCC family protein [Nocardia huaxiensis]UFS94838.1 SRPBCC family protein [Nocardia huaxiensis]
MRTKTDHRFVIDIDPDQVMEALLMVEQLPDWSPSHQDVRVAGRDKHGRPKRVYVSANVMGRPDRQVVEYVCTDDRVSWKVTESSAGAGGEGFFELAETPDGATEVWYHSEIYLPIPAPGMLLKRTARREGEVMVENFIAFVESVHGIDLTDPEAAEMPYAEPVGYEPATYQPQQHYGRGFEPGFGTA